MSYSSVEFFRCTCHEVVWHILSHMVPDQLPEHAIKPVFGDQISVAEVSGSDLQLFNYLLVEYK